MKRMKHAIVLAILTLAAGCGSEDGHKKETPPPQTISGVTVTTVAMRQIPEVVEAVGTLKARDSAAIAARLTGTVTRVFVAEGERVPKGKVLVAIDSAESGAAAAGAVSAVQEAERAVDEARARKKLADATFDRFRKLYQEEAVTRQEFEERQMEQATAAQGVARAEAHVSQARHAARGAGAIAGYGKVASPLTGVVVKKQVEAGQTVFPGMPLLVVEGENGLRLEVNPPENVLGKIRPGDKVALVLDGTPAEGKVSEVVPAVDPASRTFLVKIDVTGKTLKSGSYGKAFFPVGMRQGVSVPRDAVMRRGGLTSVWAVSPGGIARLRLVRTGRETGDAVEIISGLDPGDTIVTGGMDRVVDGAKVR